MRHPIDRRRFLIDAGATAVAAGLVSPAMLRPAIARAAGAEIPVGVMVPLTGGGSPYGPNMLKAVQLTADAINRAGGPLGRKIALYTGDTQTKPDAAVTLAQKLISLNHVIAIMGTWSSAVTLAVLPVTTQAGILELNTSGAPDITAPKYRKLVFRTQPTDEPYGVVMARFAKQKDYRKVAIMALNNPYALALRDAFEREWKRLGMPAPTAAVVYNPSQSSYAGELQKALEQKPDLLIIAGYTPDATIISKEWYAADVKTHVMGPGFAFNSSFVKAVGENVTNGFYAVDGVPPVDQPGYKAFADEFKAATGASLAESFWAAQAHDQINLLALAVEAAKSDSPAAIAAKMRDVANPPGTPVYDFASGAKLLRAGKKVNYQGASGPCDFDESHNIVSNFAVWTLEGMGLKQVALFTAKELGTSAS
ncbi:MAG TPA: ABC transporter substrate-binding protein [Candidatus Dormibacteraeota bacterium]|nr:ABC transporter substrate-binding protein [Candidatus Dormibacteraeota bacterium]